MNTLLVGIILIILGMVAIWGKFYYPKRSFKDKKLNKNEKWLLLSYKTLNDYELHLEVVAFGFMMAAFGTPVKEFVPFLLVFGLFLYGLSFVLHCRAEKRFLKVSDIYKNNSQN